MSLYAATKKANELMAHTYSHLYGLPTTGLRFSRSTAMGRPDMALFLFTRAIPEDRAIDVFNHGRMVRDFTYVDDISSKVLRTLDRTATPAADFDAHHPIRPPAMPPLGLQHRQQRAGAADGLHRGHRAAVAARRARTSCPWWRATCRRMPMCRRSPRDGLRAADAGERGRAALRSTGTGATTAGVAAGRLQRTVAGVRS